MGREVRHVHKDWEHPRDDKGRYIPLHGPRDVRALQRKWDRDDRLWLRGEHPDQQDPAVAQMGFSEWEGKRPRSEDYMPNWPVDQRTHVQMYETTTEGTPISPVMETPEELARWLADGGADAFGGRRASYEQWLRVARGGLAPSLVGVPGHGLTSGVEGWGRE